MSGDLLHDFGSEGERAGVVIGVGALKSECWSIVDRALLGERQGRDGDGMAGWGNVLPGERRWTRWDGGDVIDLIDGGGGRRERVVGEPGTRSGGGGGIAGGGGRNF